ncbi:MAG TPA: hypothetical protein VGA67_03950 [Candidatus Dojkabacteria bacterium]|jgi:hypothetical protein
MEIPQTTHRIAGSHFLKGDVYVDYESDDKDIGITDMTRALLEEKFLILENEVEL